MRHITLTIALLIAFASKAVAGETVMVCDAKNYESRYYKLVKPLFGSSNVKQKINSRWVDWCEKPECRNLEIYDSGARQEQVIFLSWDKSYPKEEIVKNQEYYIERTYLLDFEFGKRTADVKVYTNKSKTRELRLAEIRQDDKEYSCEIQ